MTDSRPHRRRRRCPPRRFGPRAAETAIFGMLVNFGRNTKEEEGERERVGRGRHFQEAQFHINTSLFMSNLLIPSYIRLLGPPE